MALVQWTASSGGDWLTAGDWSSGSAPGAGDDVQIEVPNVTVTVSTGTLQAASLTTSGSTLSVTGGTLTCLGTASIGGAYQQSGGLVLLDAGSTWALGASQTGGMLDQQAGLFQSNGLFAENGGTLVLGGQGGVFAAAVTQSAGSIQLAGGVLTSSTSFAQTGGTLSLQGNAVFAGALSQSGGGTISQTGGLLTDNGTYTQAGGNLLLGGQGALFNGAVTVNSGAITLSNGLFTANQSYTQSGGTLLLGGGGAVFHGPVVQTGGSIVLNVGQLTSYGSFLENGGSLSLGYLGGVFNALTLQSGTISSSAAVLQVYGAFVQTGGTLTSLGRDVTLGGSFSQAAGSTIAIASGALQLEGSGSLAGTISGNGTLLVQSGTTTLASGVVLSVPTVEVTGGKLVLAANTAIAKAFADYGSSSVIALNGYTLTVTGTSSLDGDLAGRGTLVAAGGGQINGLSLDGTTVLDLTSSLNETGSISLGQASGSRAQLDIAKGGQLRITGNFNTYDSSYNGTLNNAGTLAKTGGSGQANILTNLLSSGTIGVGIGTLACGGPTASFGGTVSGAGTLALTGGQDSFAKGLALKIGHLLMAQSNEQLTLANSLTYAGEWSQAGGTLWLNSTGMVLGLTGQAGLDGGLITGSGTLALSAGSHADIGAIDIEGTATLDVSGAVNQTSSVGLGQQQGSAASLIIESTAVWKLENNASLGGSPNASLNSNGTVVNNGLLETLNGSQNSNIVGTLDNAGTLSVGNSTLTLYGGGVLGGTIAGHGALDLQGNYVLASGLALSAGTLGLQSGTVTLAGNLADANIWAQSGGTLQLGGNTLTLSGTTSLEGGMISGPGTVRASGPTVLGDYTEVSLGTLVAGGATDQIGDITVGDYSPIYGGSPGGGTQPPSQATLQIASGATYRLDDTVGIAGNGTLSVAGTLSALGGGQAVVGPFVTDNGAILGNSAQLRFLGSVSGTGSLVVGASGTLDFAGSVAASNTVSFTGGTGALLLEDPTPGTSALGFGASIAGFQSGDVIELANMSTTLSRVTDALNAAGTVLSISDTSGDSASLTFATPQGIGSFHLGIGTHGDLAIFHN